MPLRTSTLQIPRRDVTVPLVEVPLNQNYVGLRVTPGLAAPARTGRVPRVPMEALRQNVVARRSRTGGANRVDWVPEDFAYECVERSLELAVPDVQRSDFSDYFDLDMVHAAILRNALMIQYERAVSAALFSTTTFTLSGNTGLDTSVTWATYASSTPIADVAAAKAGIAARSGYYGPLVGIGNRKVIRDLAQSAAVLDRMKYTGMPGAEIPDAMLAQVLGLSEIIVPDCTYNSADEGQTPTMASIWSDSYFMVCGVDASQGIINPCIGRTIYWDQGGGLFEVDQYRDDRGKADVLRVTQYTQELTIMTEMGFLIKID